MNLKHLEYLLKIREYGSISEAARQLNISQPSITKAISSLEKEYGITIFNRKARGVEFTPDGSDFILYAKSVMSVVDSFPKADKTPVFKSRVFVASQQLDLLYPAVLDAYQKCGSNNVFFNIVETDRSNVVSQVMDGTVDIGLAVRTEVDIGALVWQKAENRLQMDILDTGSVYIAVSSKSPFWKKESVTPEELKGYLQIALDMEDDVKQDFWTVNGHYSNFNNNRIIFVNTADACRHFLQNTDAIAYCSKWTRNCFNAPDLKVIPVSDYNVRQELLLIRRTGERISDAELDFAKAVCSALGKDLPAALKK